MVAAGAIKNINIMNHYVGMKDIPEIGRATQGVRVMRLKDGDNVVSMGLVKADQAE